MNRIQSAQQIRPLNSNYPQTTKQNRPNTSQTPQLSKETFDKFLNQKQMQASQGNSRRSNSAKQLPQITNSQNSTQQQQSQQQNNQQNQNQNKMPTFQQQQQQYQQEQQYQQQNQYQSQQQYQQPNHNPNKKVPNSAQYQRNLQINQYNTHKPMSAAIHRQVPQSAKYSSQTMRPKSTQYTKPLIVHVEQEFKEKQQNKHPDIDINKMSVYSREDFQKDQEHTLQDKLWDQVYYTKNKINELTQSNNDQKAKIWNIEKENRKMQKQIDSWGLQKGVVFDQNQEVFVDSTTSSRVYRDENFYAITMKQQLIDLRENLKEKQEIVKDYEHKINIFKDEIETVNEAIVDAQKEVITKYERLKDERKKLKKFQKQLEKTKNQEQNSNNNKQKYVDTLNVNGSTKVRKESDQEEEDDDGDDIEQLRFESDQLAEKINELQENNKVVLFEIQVQKQANKNCEEEKEQMTKKLQKKKKEIEQLKQELEDRGVSEEYNEWEVQKSRQPVEEKKTDDQTIKELENRIMEQKKEISELNFTIQKMTQSKIIEKQDNQKEIESSQNEIYEQEEKYLHLLCEFQRIKQKQFQQDIGIKSLNQTFFGSDPKLPTISDLEIEEDKNKDYY